MATTPDLPDDQTLALIGTDAALLGLVDSIDVMVEIEDLGDDLSEALNLSTSAVAMLAASGPHAWACLDRLLVTAVLAWDELGALDARQGVADVFDADERRCFAIVTRTSEHDLDTVSDRVLEKLGDIYLKAISVALVVSARMLWAVVSAHDVDAQGALDIVRSLPEPVGG